MKTDKRTKCFTLVIVMLLFAGMARATDQEMKRIRVSGSLVGCGFTVRNTANGKTGEARRDLCDCSGMRSCSNIECASTLKMAFERAGVECASTMVFGEILVKGSQWRVDGWGASIELVP